VLLCVNMQTSFMHPPFGFALFYLRGIAPKEVKSSSIYWGAIPWVVLQVIMVAIVIFWPGLVTSMLDKETPGDRSTIELQFEVPDYEREAPESTPVEPGKEPVKTQDSSGSSAVDDIERALKQAR